MNAPREIRFVVKSAEEAVERVRRELGPDARVVSVKQVTGSGLQRFLAAPQLEIVARAAVSDEPDDAVGKPPPAPSQPPADPAAGEQGVAEQAPATLPVDTGAAAAAYRKGIQRRNCAALLQDAGFPPTLMARLEGSAQWREITALPVEEGLPQAIAWLRQYRRRDNELPSPLRMAFLGGPGVGKTTTICKLLARAVFLHGQRPEVLRLEVDKPHMDDGLSLYCDVLGIQCKEDPTEVDFKGSEPVLVDIPGFGLGQRRERERICLALDCLPLNARVLVLNAAYDTEVLNRFAMAGAELGADCQILTHLDELIHFGKLWQHVLDPQRRLLFFANGQNVAGDLIEDSFGFLMERTFPR